MELCVILVPYDSAQYRKRMGLGPEHIFHAGIEPVLARRGARFQMETIALESAYPAEISAAFELARKIAVAVKRALARGQFPLVLSGNCNAAIGTVSGCGADRIGILWFDAHGEATTPETTRSGFLDGMPLSTLLGRAWQTLAKSVPGFASIGGERVLLIDARAAETVELELLKDAGVRCVYSSTELTAALPAISKGTDGIYLHVDLDVLDPAIVAANQWTPPGGLSVESLLEGIVETGSSAEVVALGIGSYDPAVDHNGAALSTAVSIVETLLAAKEKRQGRPPAV